jgi:hypothetical protein
MVYRHPYLEQQLHMQAVEAVVVILMVQQAQEDLAAEATVALREYLLSQEPTDSAAEAVEWVGLEHHTRLVLAGRA